MTRSFAVIGSPIVHSKSPVLHAAAYQALGLDWTYDRAELRETELEQWLSGEGQRFDGFSVTMPLKREALRLADSTDEVARVTGAVNTLVRTSAGMHGLNTDVGGIVGALRARSVTAVTSAIVLGAGATAASVLAAAASLGVEHAELRVREPDRATETAEIGRRLGLHVSVASLDAADPAEPVSVLFSALPGSALEGRAHRFQGWAPVVFDVAYDPWPSALARANVQAVCVSGLEMLFEQAVLQVRTFVNGAPDQPLPDEPLIRRSMREALESL